MMEILNSTKKVLAITERDLTLAFMVTTDALPNVCKHELLMLLGDWTHETKLEEELRHLSTSYSNFRLEVLGIFRYLNNLQVITCLLEIIIESVVDHFIRQ